MMNLTYVLQLSSPKKIHFAEWRVGLGEGPQASAHRIFIERTLAPCPIVKRFLKIHEIAGHAGQAHERIAQIGLLSFLMTELPTKDFHFFAEQSAALPEKMLIDALPARIIAADLKKGATDMKVAGAFLKNFIWSKKFTYRDYSMLLHRTPGPGIENKLGAEEYLMLRRRREVRAFDLLMEGRETGERSDYISRTGRFETRNPPSK